MTRKEIVKLAVTMGGPPETPLIFLNRDTDLSYVSYIGYEAAPGFAGNNPGKSEWGYSMHSLNETMGQPGFRPLEESWELFSDFRPPDPDIPGRYANMPKAIESCGDRYIVAAQGITGFNLATFIRGFGNFLEDIYTEEANANALLDMVFSFEERVCSHLCAYDIDAVAYYDDWGTQRSLMIGPGKWREMFKPRYKRQFDLAHSLGKQVFFHCCGQIIDIIPDLIEIGADILNLNQPELFGIENMGRMFGGKTCFCCPVDHQTVALTGSREEIFDYVYRLKANLSVNGGFIGNIEDYSICGMTDERYHDIADAFLSLNGAAAKLY